MTYYIIWYGAVIPQYYQKKIDDCQKTIEKEEGYEFQLLHFPEFTGTPEEAATAKDNLELSMACTTPDGVFLDADIDLHHLLVDMEPGKPYFAICAGQGHISYFAVNGCCEFFTALLEERAQRGIGDVYKFPRKLLRGKDVFEIPENSFKHHFKMNTKV
jgi:hypothetical protein